FFTNCDHDVDKLPRPELALGVRESRLQLNCAGGAVDGVVDEAKLPAHRRGRITRWSSRHFDGASCHRGANRAELVFGYRKSHISGKDLVDGDHGSVGLRFYESSGFHLQAARAPINRRTYLAIRQIQFR